MVPPPLRNFATMTGPAGTARLGDAGAGWPIGMPRRAQEKDQGYVYMILLTSKGLKADVVAGLGAGADDYLTKPFDTEELKARLRTGQRILHLEGGLVEAREDLRFKATGVCFFQCAPTTTWAVLGEKNFL
jgi:hypothetical protein